ncbi:MAG: hypothetical protein Q9163_002983 [Psora crenata]
MLTVTRLKRSRRILIFAKGNPSALASSWAAVVSKFSPKWRHDLGVPNTTEPTTEDPKPRVTYASRLTECASDDVLKYIVQWMNSGGIDFSGNGAVKYPESDLQMLQDIRNLATILGVTALVQRTAKDIQALHEAKFVAEQRAQALTEKRANAPPAVARATKLVPEYSRGLCSRCNKDGHRKNDCDVVDTTLSRCYRCGRKGHYKKDCDVLMIQRAVEAPRGLAMPLAATASINNQPTTPAIAKSGEGHIATTENARRQPAQASKPASLPPPKGPTAQSRWPVGDLSLSQRDIVAVDAGGNEHTLAFTKVWIGDTAIETDGAMEFRATVKLVSTKSAGF